MSESGLAEPRKGHLFLAIVQIARLCHEANRAYCESLGDLSQMPWEQAPAWQRESAVNGVVNALENPGGDAGMSHRNWLAKKAADGWTYGRVKNAERKEHPCMVPFCELPPEQQRKDHLFLAIVQAMTRPL